MYVADTDNNRISVFTPRSPIGNVAYFSEDGVIFGNGTTDQPSITDQMILPGIF